MTSREEMLKHLNACDRLNKWQWNEYKEKFAKVVKQYVRSDGVEKKMVVNHLIYNPIYLRCKRIKTCIEALREELEKPMHEPRICAVCGEIYSVPLPTEEEKKNHIIKDSGMCSKCDYDKVSVEFIIGKDESAAIEKRNYEAFKKRMEKNEKK